jgi:hypothetical protein
VPIQPRSLFSPSLVTTFHVTNRGLGSPTLAFSSFFKRLPSEKILLRLLLLLVAELASLIPLGVELTLGTLDEFDVEGGDARSRDTAAGR